MWISFFWCHFNTFLSSEIFSGHRKQSIFWYFLVFSCSEIFLGSERNLFFFFGLIKFSGIFWYFLVLFFCTQKIICVFAFLEAESIIWCNDQNILDFLIILDSENSISPRKFKFVIYMTEILPFVLLEIWGDLDNHCLVYRLRLRFAFGYAPPTATTRQWLSRLPPYF